MALTKGQKIAIVISASGLAALGGWFFFMYKPNHPKAPKPGNDVPPSDPNKGIFNIITTIFPPSTTKTWGNIAVGNKLTATSDTAVFADASMTKPIGLVKAGEYVGVLQTKYQVGGYVANYSKCWANDTGCKGFVPPKSYKVG